MLPEGNLQLLGVIGLSFLLGALVACLIGLRINHRRFLKRVHGAKDEFVAIASHYLLTPISIIQGALARLQESESTLTAEERHKLYLLIEKGQQRLWILAEEFVLVNQIKEGGLNLSLVPADISDLVSDAVAAVHVFAQEREIHVVFDDKVTTVREARVDVRRFKQAMIAIIDNAVKFSPDKGNVLIRIAQEPHAFSIEVSDEGEGISEKSIKAAGQTFSRGNTSYTFDHEGIGLGLYTAYAIVREHGGEMSFARGPKRGTTVLVRFPF